MISNGMTTFLLNETRYKVITPEHFARKPRMKGLLIDGKLPYQHTVWKFRISKKSSLYEKILESPNIVLDAYICKNNIVLDKPTVFNLLAMLGTRPKPIQHLHKATLGGFECLQILNSKATYKATEQKSGFDELLAL